MLPYSSAVRQVTRRTALVLRLLLLVGAHAGLKTWNAAMRVALQTSCESCRLAVIFGVPVTKVSRVRKC